jgi:hypothetical protein
VSTIGRAKEVNVRVDKAWQHGSSPQVYQFSMLSTQTAYLVIRAYSQDIAASSIDGHSLRSWLRRVHGIDISV